MLISHAVQNPVRLTGLNRQMINGLETAKTGEISVRHGLRGGGCSSCQTRLRSKIPDNWEIKWEFCEKGRSQQTYDAFSAILSMCCS